MTASRDIAKWLTRVDENLTHRFSNGTNKPLKKFLLFYTELGSSLGAGLIFLILFAISGLKVMKFIPIYLIQLAIVELIKKFVRRQRPKIHMMHLAETNIFGIPVSSGSFPSGHTSNITTLAILISNFYDLSVPVAIATYLAALTVAISRLYLHKHYLLDVLGGFLIGSVVSFLLINIL